jgi:ElaB/YqjD/DUF883 family membrane-anchored ribosome-binding protein
MMARRETTNAMNNPFSIAPTLDPEAGFTQTPSESSSPSISQAANDLRAAAGEKAREFVQTAETKAAAFKERAVESAQNFRDNATEKAAALKSAATEKAHHIKETATEQWQDTRVKAKEIQVTAEDYIRQNPTKCVVSALGLGFLIGLIVRR